MIRTATTLLAAAALTASANAVVTSTFDTTSEGWTGLNDFNILGWSAQGTPSGSLRGSDLGRGTIWGFVASDDYYGDMSSYYAGTLSWDILGIAGNQTSIPNRADVMLTGGNIRIGVVLDVQPVNGQWTSWDVTLSTASDWKIVSSLSSATLSTTTATEAQIMTVLSNLTQLYIRGEYTNTGGDSTALDNVRLVPAPGAAALLLAGGAAAARRRRA